MRTESPLLAPIFRSDGQARLLSVLLISDEEYSISDLANRADLAYATTHREVDRLLEAGILAERVVGRTRLIRADHDSPIYGPLREIAFVISGPVVLLSTELKTIGGIGSAFVFGSFAARYKGAPGGSPHDVDVMVVGEPDPDSVYDACERVEESVGRPVNPTIMTIGELESNSGFLDDVKDHDVIPLVGELPWD